LVSQNQTFVEDTSINRPPLFVEEIIHFWKSTWKYFLNKLTGEYKMLLLMVHSFPFK